jgi:hypothetical protein
MLLDVTRDIRRHSGACVTHHHDVAAHGFERVDRVEDTLALFSGRGVDVEIKHVGAQAFSRKIEGRARARAGLEEQVGNGATGEGFAARRETASRGEVALGIVEHIDKQRPVEALQREQMAQAAVGVQLQAGVVLEDLVGLGGVHRAGILH